MNRVDYIFNCIGKRIIPDITPETNEEARFMKLAKGIVNEPYTIRIKSNASGDLTLESGNLTEARNCFYAGVPVQFSTGAEVIKASYYSPNGLCGYKITENGIFVYELMHNNTVKLTQVTSFS